MVQQILGALAGFAVIAFLVSVKKDFFLEPRFVYGLLGLTALLLALCLAMPSVANTNRWIVLPGFRFQPSELAKISLILFLATFIESRKDSLNDKKTLAVLAAVIAGVVVLVLLEPDFGTAVLLAGLAATVLFLGGVKLRYLAAAGLVAGILFGVLSLPGRLPGRPHPGLPRLRQGRPRQRLPGRPVQARPGLGRVGRGGPRRSTQKLNFLPFNHTDFIFAILGEETGLVGTIVTLGLYLFFLWRGLKIALEAPTPAYKMIAGGHHPGHRRPGPDEHVDRPRPGPGQGNSPPPPLLRPVLPRLHAGRRGHPAPHQPEEGGHREHGEDMIS